MSHIQPNIFENLLRQGGYKVTPGRVAILEVLESSGKPLNIIHIVKKLEGKLNPTTVYRALEALSKSGFVHKVNLQHSHTHYELIAGANHHHHIVCERCGLVEDIENCNTQNLEKATLKRSQEFDALQSHSLEFFGVCRKCTKTAAR